jgi:hypothetical protein
LTGKGRDIQRGGEIIELSITPYVITLLDVLSDMRTMLGDEQIFREAWNRLVSPRTKSFIHLSARKILYMAEVANRNVELNV